MRGQETGWKPEWTSWKLVLRGGIANYFCPCNVRRFGGGGSDLIPVAGLRTSQRSEIRRNSRGGMRKVNKNATHQFTNDVLSTPCVSQRRPLVTRPVRRKVKRPARRSLRPNAMSSRISISG